MDCVSGCGGERGAGHVPRGMKTFSPLGRMWTPGVGVAMLLVRLVVGGVLFCCEKTQSQSWASHRV